MSAELFGQGSIGVLRIATRIDYLTELAAARACRRSAVGKGLALGRFLDRGNSPTGTWRAVRGIKSECIALSREGSDDLAKRYRIRGSFEITFAATIGQRAGGCLFSCRI